MDSITKPKDPKWDEEFWLLLIIYLDMN